MNLNVENKNDMINLIESLIGKDEYESNSKYYISKFKLILDENNSKNDEKYFENTIKKDN